MRTFISNGTWFDKGTCAEIIADYGEDKIRSCPCLGIFEGLKDGELDEEQCSFDEFEIFGDKPPDTYKNQYEWKTYKCKNCRTNVHTVNVPEDETCLLCWKAAQQ